jgi:hypothetical protein
MRSPIPVAKPRKPMRCVAGDHRGSYADRESIVDSGSALMKRRRIVEVDLSEKINLNQGLRVLMHFFHCYLGALLHFGRSDVLLMGGD